MFDCISKIIDVTGETPVEMKGFVPARSVVIPGSYTKKFPAGDFQVPCAIIIGTRKPSTDLIFEQCVARI
jgi:2,3,4,5-tetrahydropyridine-2-carboxylate N-succinyltransferase